MKNIQYRIVMFLIILNDKMFLKIQDSITVIFDWIVPEINLIFIISIYVENTYLNCYFNFNLKIILVIYLYVKTSILLKLFCYIFTKYAIQNYRKFFMTFRTLLIRIYIYTKVHMTSYTQIKSIKYNFIQTAGRVNNS
jgi:hypothetical protein